MAMQKDTSENRDMLIQALDAIETLEARLEKAQRGSGEAVAIVGMSCRFPGAPSTSAYWDLLKAGRDVIAPYPGARLDMLGDAEGLRGVVGGFLPDVDLFEPSHFGVSGREARCMDPQQRLLLEVSWEALEDAGIVPATLKNTATGVFVGVTTNDYARLVLSQGADEMDVYAATGGALNVAAGRLSYTYGFNGPAASIDTACSSSLVALHMAVRSLRQRESDLVLAGGVNVLLSPEPFACFVDWGMMAPDGRCKAFDEKADGFVRSEGCGLLVLKRLQDAEAQGDRILAVIRGTAVNQDGASSGLTVPNGPAQVAVLKTAIADAEVRANDVDYVEAHGTGTVLGDPIELEAIAQVYCKNRGPDNALHVGSVKTNIGHAESASGIAGLIKVVLSMQHQEIPRHLHFNKMSPNISLGRAEVKIPTKATPWLAKDGDRRVGAVSSFGFSGTNAHAIIEAYDAPSAVSSSTPDDRPCIIPISARNKHSLEIIGARYAEHLGLPGAGSIRDVAASAIHRRTQFPLRSAVVSNTCQAASNAFRAFSEGREHEMLRIGSSDGPSTTIFLFTGQGSQYPGMGDALYRTEPVYRERIDQCSEILCDLLEVPLCDVLGYTGKSVDEASGLDNTRFAQPAIFAVEYALFCLWASWGVRPDYLCGHSLGEYVAACAADVLSLEDSLVLVARRASMMSEISDAGAMASVLTGADQIEELIAGYDGLLSVAAYNSPFASVVSGDEKAVEDLCKKLESQSIQARRLRVSHAFHSRLMEPILEDFRVFARSMSYSAATIPIILNETGCVGGKEEIDGDYWTRHIRQPVHFAKSMQTAAELGTNVYLELGPSPTLLSLAAMANSNRQVTMQASMKRDSDAGIDMRLAAAGLYTAGLNLDWSEMGQPKSMYSSVPTYGFNRQSFWLDVQKIRRTRRSVFATGLTLEHPFLAARVDSPNGDVLFQLDLDLDHHKSLADHRISGVVLFPGTGYIEAARAIGEALGMQEIELRNGSIQKPLVLSATELEIMALVSPSTGGARNIRFHSRLSTGDDWRTHAVFEVASSGGREMDWGTPEKASESCRNLCAVDELREKMRSVGLEYGDSFLGLREVMAGVGRAFGRIDLVEHDSLVDSTFIHPGIFDAALHLIAAAVDQADDDGDERFYLPFSFEKIEFGNAVGSSALASLEVMSSGSDAIVVNLTVWNAERQPAVRVSGLRARGVSRAEFKRLTESSEPSLVNVLSWTEFEPSDRTAAPQEIVILGNQTSQSSGFVAAVSEALQGQGHRVELAGDIAACVALGTGRHWVDMRPVELDIASQEHPERATGDVLNLLKAAARNGADQITVVTRDAVAIAGDTRVNAAQTAIHGLLGSAAAELTAKKLKVIDITDDAPAPAIADVIADSGLESRIAVHGQAIYVARLHDFEPATSGNSVLPVGCYSLELRTKGTLDGVTYVPAERIVPGPGQVEIEVLASGVNFRDVLNCLDMYPGPAGALGNECAGRVIALGSDVADLAIGDLVCCIANSTYSSHVVAQRELTFKIPSTLSVAQAASFPISQLTAYLCLIHLGKLSKGQAVLVHAAAGGVGLAAVHIALATGARVVATAGSERKREYLRQLGVGHVFDSRTTLSHDDVLNATAGAGVDIVLNSLTGDAITEGVLALKPGGRFIEIGLREVLDADALTAIRKDVFYDAVLLGDYCREEPELVQGLFANLVDNLEKRLIPAPPCHVFPAGDVASAFRFMANASHIGRLSLIHPTYGENVVRDDSSYVISGGLGALGLHAARWLVARGARHLILLGRSAPSASAQAAIEMLANQQVDIRVLAVDIGSGEHWSAALADLPPVRGVLHAAGVVNDAILIDVDEQSLAVAMRPKAHGLLALTRELDPGALDFTVLYSSGSAILGSPGQSAYSAANAYMDGYAAAECHQGNHCVSINWGAWASGGMAAELDERTKEEWFNRGIGMISDQDGDRYLELAVGSGRSQVAPLAIAWDKFAGSLPSGEIPPLFADVCSGRAGGEDAPSAGNPFLERLTSLEGKRRSSFLVKQVRSEISAVMGMAATDLDARSGLTEQGMDSLMAVEVAGRLGRLIERPLPSTYAFDHPTINALAAAIGELLGDVVGEQISRESENIDMADLSVDEMSESELEAALRSEIDLAEKSGS